MSNSEKCPDGCGLHKPKLSGYKTGGVLRCAICGDEIPREGETKGLNYGWPVCCGQRRMYVSPERLREEQDYYVRVEEEEQFMRSVEM